MSGPQIRTIAFPHAGGGAHSYRDLKHHLQVLDLAPFEYPGHGRRLREPLSTTLDELVHDVLHQHERLFESNEAFALLGFSMGARVAFRLDEVLAARGLRRPACMVLCGSRAPGAEDREPLAELADGALLDRLEELGGMDGALRAHPELLEMMLPILRADLNALESAASQSSHQTTAPLVVLFGADDPEVELEHVEPWRDRTQATCVVQQMQGDHFAIHQYPGDAATRIDSVVAGLLR